MATGSPIQFTNSVVNSGNAGDWSVNGTSFVIPVSGIYVIKFMVNSDGDTGHPHHNFALDITDSPNAFNQDGVDQGYFQFGAAVTGALSGQIIEQCTAGDNISVNNVSVGALSIGSLVPTNAPSATISIMQIQTIQAN